MYARQKFAVKDEKSYGGEHSKERLTLLLAVNMEGSEKSNPLIIGNAAPPRCSKDIHSFLTTYRLNLKAWMTTEFLNSYYH